MRHCNYIVWHYFPNILVCLIVIVSGKLNPLSNVFHLHTFIICVLALFIKGLLFVKLIWLIILINFQQLWIKHLKRWAICRNIICSPFNDWFISLSANIRHIRPARTRLLSLSANIWYIRPAGNSDFRCQSTKLLA